MSNAYINFTFESKTDWVKKINECQKEIERQKEIIRQLDIKNLELTNIIKEVREYITTIKDEDIQYTIGWIKQDILEILDKVRSDK